MQYDYKGAINTLADLYANYLVAVGDGDKKQENAISKSLSTFLSTVELLSSQPGHKDEKFQIGTILALFMTSSLDVEVKNRIETVAQSIFIAPETAANPKEPQVNPLQKIAKHAENLRFIATLQNSTHLKFDPKTGSFSNRKPSISSQLKSLLPLEKTKAESLNETSFSEKVFAEVADMMVDINQLEQAASRTTLTDRFKALTSLKESLLLMTSDDSSFSQWINKATKPLKGQLNAIKSSVNNILPYLNSVIVDMGRKYDYFLLPSDTTSSAFNTFSLSSTTTPSFLDDHALEKVTKWMGSPPPQGADVARELIKEKVELKPLLGKDHIAYLPAQAAADFPRYSSFSVAGKLLVNCEKGPPIDPGGQYREFERLCEENLFNLGVKDAQVKSQLLARRIVTLLTQSLIADTMVPSVYLLSEGKGCNPDMARSFHSKVDFNKEDKTVVIEMKLMMRALDMVPPAYLIIKRTMTLKVDELLEKDIETSANPLPSLVVKDDYSLPLHTKEFADEIFEKF